ncbi:MAG: type II toxin-antitoxin system PemK/MazF family toxin [Blastocatellales bacterium]
METPSAGSIVLVPFPFSDLTNSKLRPAVVIADAGKGDWVMCQITSNPYSDLSAIRVTDDDFYTGSLKLVSFVRPGKLFTANESLIAVHIGELKQDTFERIVTAVIGLLRSGLDK